MEVIVDHVLGLSNTVTMKSAFRWSMGVAVVVQDASRAVQRSFAACPRLLPLASKSRARLFKPSQATTMKEKNLEQQLRLKSYGISAHFFTGSAPLPLLTELITRFAIQKFWNHPMIWKRNTTIASKTTAYTTNDLVLISSSACTSLR
jgi:hypothetical protein